MCTSNFVRIARSWAISHQQMYFMQRCHINSISQSRFDGRDDSLLKPQKSLHFKHSDPNSQFVARFKFSTARALTLGLSLMCVEIIPMDEQPHQHIHCSAAEKTGIGIIVRRRTCRSQQQEHHHHGKRELFGKIIINRSY